MNDVILSLIKTCAEVIIFGIAAHYIKQVIDKGFAKEIAEHKAQLDKNAERFRTDLQISSSEHQIRFAQLHADRADVIKELWRQICVARQEVSDYLRSWEQDKYENEKKASETVKKLESFFVINELYFKEDTCQLVKEMLQTYSKIFGHQGLAEQIEAAHQFSKKKPEMWSTLKLEVNHMFENDIPKIKESLASDFRKYLGVA